MSRATMRWCSSATARRCAVGRASPVAATSPARVAGPSERSGQGLPCPERRRRYCCPCNDTRVSLCETQVQFSVERATLVDTAARGPTGPVEGVRTRGADAAAPEISVGPAPHRPAGGKAMGRTLAERSGRPCRPARRGRARPPLHRSAPAARGDQPAGLRRPPRGGASRAPSTSPSPPRITTPRPSTSTSPSRTRSPGPSWRPCARTAPSSVYGCTHWVTSSRASSTWWDRSWV